MKIIFFEVEDFEKDFLQKAFSQDVLFTPYQLNLETVEEYKDATIVSSFIYSHLARDVLEKLPDVKYITTRSTGFDHIDIEYCKKRGIIVSNVPAYGVHTVAEHTFALILALTKKIIPSIERTRKGDFSIEGLQGVDLNGKTIGVIGAGKIGTSVVHIARCFGMHVLLLSRHNELSENSNVEYVNLKTLLQRSDIVTLHLPLTPETKHFINKTNIKEFKKGAYLINTARGGLIDTQALLMGLEKGIFSGVALDVLEDECDLKEERQLLSTEFLKACDLKTDLMEHMLMGREDVLITPHNAFHTKEAVEEILKVTVGNITSFEKGEYQNVVE